jgi:hypothetical protein
LRVFSSNRATRRLSAVEFLNARGLAAPRPAGRRIHKSFHYSDFRGSRDASRTGAALAIPVNGTRSGRRGPAVWESRTMSCPHLKEVVMLFCDAYPVKKMLPLDRLATAHPCLGRDFEQCPLFRELMARLENEAAACSSAGCPGAALREEDHAARPHAHARHVGRARPDRG